MSRAIWSILVIAPALLVTALGCSSVHLAEEREDLFSQAVEASLAGEPALAARAAHHYQRTGSVDDSRYDRAGRLLAQNLLDLELSYASSLWYHDIAVARRDAELVEASVLRLGHIVENYPHDRWLLVDGFLATAEMARFGDEATAMVAYYQGRHSLQQGETRWAVREFEKIPRHSPYRARARYVMAVRLLADYQLDQARQALEELLEDFEDDLPDDLETDIYRTLARIAFEEGRFDDALEGYEAIRATAPDDPHLLLEMAWTEYYRDNYRRSLGLLLALDAPTYRELIAPERFLLEAFNLQSLCQFEPARIAARRLGAQYGTALDDLHAGVALEDSQALRVAARRRETSQPITSFRDRLELERRHVEYRADDLGARLTAELLSLYDDALADVDRREAELLASEMRAVASDLLNAERGVQLVLHEISVTLLRGRGHARTGVAQAQPVFEAPRSGELVYFRFSGEFWTDEVDDLIVPLEDRCIE